jgi:hypothetical protein
VRRLVASASLLVAALLAPAPALADSFATYATVVTGLQPAVPGITVTALRDGQAMTVTNTSSTVITIYGYQGEPYVRIQPDGVWENTLSPAVYLNKEQTIGEFPKSANAEAAPHWAKISDAHRFQWHDHRIHWMGATNPPSVEQSPNKTHLINTWKVPFSIGTATQPTGDIVGTLTYHPSSHLGSYLTWGAIAGALLIVVSLQLFLRRRPRPART